MTKTKKRAAVVCSHCGSSEAMYLDLGGGKLLPSFAIEMATGARSCYPCRDKGGK